MRYERDTFARCFCAARRQALRVLAVAFTFSAVAVFPDGDLLAQPASQQSEVERSTIGKKSDAEDREAKVRESLPNVPGYWPMERAIERPELSDVQTIRFITTADYPPFNYLDATGVLVGFNIDVAWGICTALKVRCTVRRVDWDKMAEELETGKADAAIASHRISRSTRQRFLFSDRYYDTPARFVVRKEDALQDVNPDVLDGRSVAVVKGTAHEAFLRTFFEESDVKVFDRPEEAGEALRTGSVDAYFDDAIGLVFWLEGLSSRGCCRFAGGAYSEPRFFGNGVGIALRKDNHRLKRILDYGLDRVRRSGLYQRLFTRYFPQALF